MGADWAAQDTTLKERDAENKKLKGENTELKGRWGRCVNIHSNGT